MNRYAMSPVLLSELKVVDIVVRNGIILGLLISLQGFYVFKGTVDNFAEVTITQDSDNSESPANLLEVVKKVNGFRTEKKDLTSNKIFLYKGKVILILPSEMGEN